MMPDEDLFLDAGEAPPPASVVPQGPPLPEKLRAAQELAARLRDRGLTPERLAPRTTPAQDLTTPPAPTAEERLEKLRNTRALAESLDKMGRGLAGLRGSPQANFQPAGTRVLDDTISDAEDVIGGPDREFLQQQGLAIPEGARQSRTGRLVPSVLNQSTDKARLLQGDRRLDQGDKRLAADQAKFQIAEARRNYAMHRAPRQVVEKIVGYDNVMKALDRTEEFAQQAGFGPLIGQAQQAMNKAGLASPEFASLRAEISNVLSSHLRNVSGLTVSDNEAKRVADQVMSTSQRGDTFQALLQRFRTQVEAERENLINNFEGAGQGYDMGFAKTGQASTQAPAGGKVRFKVGSDSYEIDPADEAEFLKDNPNAQRQ